MKEIFESIKQFFENIFHPKRYDFQKDLEAIRKKEREAFDRFGLPDSHIDKKKDN
jgi:hypothetical protein